MIKLSKLKILYFLLLVVLCSFGYAYRYYTLFEKIDFQTSFASDAQKPKILLIDVQKGFGGGQIAAVAHYKALLNAGYKTSMLTYKNGYLDSELSALRLPHYACRTFKFTHHKKSYLLGFANHIRAICKREKIDLVHCNNVYEVFDVRNAVQGLPVKVVFTRHLQDADVNQSMAVSDGAIAVNEITAGKMSEQRDKLNDGACKVIWIPAFWEYEKFATYQLPEQDRNSYFKEKYNIEFATDFVVVNVAALLPYKNQQFLFEALKLAIDDGKPFDILLVGRGPQEAYLKQRTQELKIEQYIHFAGFCKEVAPLIKYADALALVSTTEAFPLVLAEGGICKKPLVGVVGAGMDNVIKHQSTGFLVDQGNREQLAQTLIALRDDAKLCKKLGDSVFHFVQNKFSTEAILAKLEQFYAEVLAAPQK